MPDPGYTPAGMAGLATPSPRQYTESNSAVGLRSVAQLSLYAQFSGFQGMTEGYNVRIIDNPNDHKYILQKK